MITPAIRKCRRRRIDRMKNQAMTPELRAALDVRNAKIRHAVLVDKRKPIDVAKEHDISASRIYQLCYPERYLPDEQPST